MPIFAIFGIIAVVSFGIGMYAGVKWDSASHKAETITAQKEEIRIDQAQDEVTADAGTQAVIVQEKIRTVFRDRIVYRDREVPYEVTLRTDSGCVIPNYFVGLWNSANQGTVPDASRGIDESPSGVTLTDVERQKERETEICLANTEQLIGLQGWVRDQQAVE
ncbi:hypothetical protein SAMN05216420_101420 [Nitrosospira sp. Nl5]|uniref:hypothetical protein n=1 Tax=Nitrosospira sp. Nl5 TaxID=200120 RepID=UPI0008900D3F|nr:hypothetical protein [Nitrosospira sp. Nl5]SCX94865.1 hypothetical protein SAMN05216420_101420 [Nitrosospira sp. Nl5]